MIAAVPIHAIAGQFVPPANHILVVYLDGEESHDQWTEVNTAGGWGFRYVLDPATGAPQIVDDELQTERVEGEFRLRWKLMG